MELWDAYFRDGTPEDCDLIRGKSVPEGLYHLVSEIVVQHIDGDFLIMQRDFNKSIHLGKYEITAGGSVTKGENALEGAVRELFEETGIKADNLKFEYTEISDVHHSIFNMYYCLTDCDKSSVMLQKGETIAYKWISLNDLIKDIKRNPENFCTIGRLKKCTVFNNSGL